MLAAGSFVFKFACLDMCGDDVYCQLQTKQCPTGCQFPLHRYLHAQLGLLAHKHQYNSKQSEARGKMLLLESSFIPFSHMAQAYPSYTFDVHYLIFPSLENLLRVLVKGQNPGHLQQWRLRTFLKMKDKEPPAPRGFS